MKFLNSTLILSACLMISCQSSSKKVGGKEDLTKMTDGPASEQQLPAFTTAVLKNQTEVLWMRDEKLPSLSIKILIKGGLKDEVKGKSGAMGLMARLLDKGTVSKSAEQIAEFFESQGAQFSASAADDYTMISLDGLSPNQAEVIPMFLEVVFAPTFPEAEFQREKLKVSNEIRRLPDEPSAFADIAFQKYLYAGTPYGRLMENLSTLTRKDILQAYKDLFQGRLIKVGVVGQWTEDTKTALESSLNALPEGEGAMQKPVVFPAFKGRKFRLIAKDDLKQTQIRIGGEGVARKDKDFLALSVASSALGAGGSFASRMIQEIRVKRGLTYSIYGNFEAHLDIGSYEISTFTRHEKIHETVEQTLALLSDFANKGMTQEELTNNRSFLTGLIARQTETTNEVMNRLLLMRAYDVPDSYLIDFNKNLKALDLKSLNAVIKKDFPSENVKILVYGPKKEALEQLSKFGTVEVVDYKNVLSSSSD